MNLYNIWVSLSEMSDKNIELFHDIQFFLDVPVCSLSGSNITFLKKTVRKKYDAY